ncbi:MAG: serine hydrolase [Lachnospiraceae bacterium]|nr:serine hydrolase [Lachnospiraceae bacterium]
MKRFLFWAVIVLCSSIVFGKSYSHADDEGESINETELYAQAAVLLDAESGRVLYDKNGNEKLPNASTTKIMTCILILEQAEPGEVAEVSHYAAAQPKVHLGVRAGDRFKLEDLLYSLMLESHNDSAVILAEYVGARQLGMTDAAGQRKTEDSKQAVAAFSEMMNEKAREIGCLDTFFLTPNGLDAVKGEMRHGTTAVDLARIMAYCVKMSPMKDAFLRITQTRSYQFMNEERTRSFTCTNHNAFLDMMSGVLSGKTGFTNSAGYCYVGALQRDDRTYTIALLACGWPNHKTYKWSDSRKLFEYGIEYYRYREFMPTPSIEPLVVENGQAEDQNPYHTVSIMPQMETQPIFRILCCEQESMCVETEYRSKLNAPVRRGDSLGCLNYYFVTSKGEKILWERVALTAGENVDAKDAGYAFRYLLHEFFLFN